MDAYSNQINKLIEEVIETAGNRCQIRTATGVSHY